MKKNIGNIKCYYFCVNITFGPCHCVLEPKPLGYFGILWVNMALYIHQFC